MISVAIAPLLISLFLTGDAAAVRPDVSCPSLAQVPTLLQKIHALDWTNASVVDLQGMVAVRWELIEAKIPSDSVYATGPCTGSTYLKFESAACSLSLEFRNRKFRSRCASSLHSVRAEFDGSRQDVAAAHAMALASLRATGPVCDDVEQYRWRSDDSRTLYDLSIATTSDAHHDRLSLWLTHRLVPKEMIDGLPFSKGYFPPASQRNNRD